MPKSTRIHLFVAVVVASSISCSDIVAVPEAPRQISPNRIASRIRALPNYAHFGPSGATFFKNKLYVSSNIGLFVLGPSGVETLYSWVEQDDVVEGPWGDPAGGSLWIQHAHDNSLARFDGTSWRRVSMPRPAEGYTRGDVLTGFLGIGTSNGFWLVGGGHAWRFGAQHNSWTQEPEPRMPPYSAIRSIAPGTASMSYVVREGLEVIPPSTYAVYDRGNQWARAELPGKIDFGATVIGDAGVYIRAKDGRLFFAGHDSVDVLATPGMCEAIAQASSGQLVASFVGQGIFVFDHGQWIRKLPYPYSTGEGEHWAYLAESNGQFAYATTSVPHYQSGDKFTYSGSNAIWVQRGERLEQVSLP